MKIRLRYLFFLLQFILELNIYAFSGAAVTHRLHPGRFGDNLINYMHAKWISYVYDIPLLYAPFSYSDKLCLHEKELRLSDYEKSFINKVYVNSGTTIDKKSNTLYIVPYFPECSFEAAYVVACGHIVTNWEDCRFQQILASLVSPRFPLDIKIKPPSDRIAVALHVRTGGSYAVDAQMKKLVPMKFPNDDYYIHALEIMNSLLHGQNLYVYIFTDDDIPKVIVERYKKIFQKNSNIVFACKPGKNSYDTDVLEDFFAFVKFDCIIMPYSNFSLCASMLKSYAVKILPQSGVFYKDTFNTTDLNVAINIKYFENNLVVQKRCSE